LSLDVDVVNSLTRLSLPRTQLSNFGGEQAVLIELFPDVEADIILDALDFCDGNRNAAIQLLAKQNRLSTPTDELDGTSGDELDDVDGDEEDVGYGFTNNTHMFLEVSR